MAGKEKAQSKSKNKKHAMIGSAEVQTLDFLQKIQSGVLDPKLLDPDCRQQLLQVLIFEGYSTAESAKILEVSDKTIERDKKYLREKLALKAHPQLAELLAGQLLQQAEWSQQKFHKLVQDPQTPPAQRIDAICQSVNLQIKLIETLQSLGFLPNAMAKAKSRTQTETITTVASWQDLETELIRLENCQILSPEEREQLVYIKRNLEIWKIGQEIKEISCRVLPEGAES